MTLRVLVVDDEAAVASTLQAYLEDEGMAVRSAGSAEEALELLRTGVVFDVCIMDMRLPGMHGNAAIRRLHRVSASNAVCAARSVRPVMNSRTTCAPWASATCSCS